MTCSRCGRAGTVFDRSCWDLPTGTVLQVHEWASRRPAHVGADVSLLIRRVGVRRACVPGPICANCAKAGLRPCDTGVLELFPLS